MGSKLLSLAWKSVLIHQLDLQTFTLHLTEQRANCFPASALNTGTGHKSCACGIEASECNSKEYPDRMWKSAVAPAQYWTGISDNTGWLEGGVEPVTARNPQQYPLSSDGRVWKAAQDYVTHRRTDRKFCESKGTQLKRSVGTGSGIIKWETKAHESESGGTESFKESKLLLTRGGSVNTGSQGEDWEGGGWLKIMSCMHCL